MLPEYNDLKPWEGKEVADLMYQDRTGEMEEFIREYSFDEFPDWSDSSSSDNDEEIEDSRHDSQKLEEYPNSDTAVAEDTEENSSQDEEYEEEDSGNSDEEVDARDLERNDSSRDEDYMDENGVELQEEEVSDQRDIGHSPDTNQPIEYHLEVKTTVGECDTTFFMSKNQYEQVSFLRISHWTHT